MTYRNRRLPLLPSLIAIGLLAGACSSDDGSGDDDGTAQTDGSVGPDIDGAVSKPDIDADNVPATDADLTERGMVQIDGDVLLFEYLYVYEGSLNDRTLSAEVGFDCPVGSDCKTLYVSFPESANPGYKSCDDEKVTVQFSDGSSRYFSFSNVPGGGGNLFCGFQLEINSEELVVISDLSAQLERLNSPGDVINLSNGELVGDDNPI